MLTHTHTQAFSDTHIFRETESKQVYFERKVLFTEKLEIYLVLVIRMEASAATDTRSVSSTRLSHSGAS